MIADTKTFISHKYESDEHNAWVDKLVTDLRNKGILCSYDVTDIKIGDRINHYMTTEIQNSRNFVLILTPEYIKSYNSGYGNIYFEVDQAITLANENKLRFITIYKIDTDIPSFIRGIRYLDFRNEKNYETRLNELVITISGPGNSVTHTEEKESKKTNCAKALAQREPNFTSTINKYEDFCVNLGGIFRTPFSLSEITTWLPIDTNYDYLEEDIWETNIAPPSLIRLMLKNLNELKSDDKSSQKLALSILKSEVWDDNMENPLWSLISDKETSKFDKVAVIGRLIRIENGKTVPLLKKIICSNLRADIKYLAIAAIIQMGYATSLVFDENCYNDLDKSLIKDLIAEAKNPSEDNLWKGTASYDFREKIKTLFISVMGHCIHKLKAKDTTGKWAYYFVLVNQSNETEFLEKIESDETIDLEDYGKVIASSYGERPTEEVVKYLKDKYDFDI